MTAKSAEAVAGLPELPMDRDPSCPFDPPKDLYRIRQQSPTQQVRIWDGSSPWLVTRYADQRMVLSHPAVSADFTRPGFPHTSLGSKARRFQSPNMVSLDDPEHALLRRALMPFFTVRRVEALRPRIQDIVDSLVDGLLERPGNADLVRDFALPIPTYMICEIFGAPYDDREFLHRHSSVMVSRVATAGQVHESVDAVQAWLRAIIEQRSAAPRNDLASHLGSLADRGVISLQQAIEISLHLMVAGHDTTANMIALGSLVLMEHREQLDELVASADPELLGRAVEELLRYLTVNHNGRRRVALDDLEIGGTLVPAGAGIICAQNIGNRDPEAFQDPDAFDIHRDARRHIAFGFGVHQCLGQALSRVELAIAYRTLFSRIPTLRPAIPIGDLDFKSQDQVFGLVSLPVIW